MPRNHKGDCWRSTKEGRAPCRGEHRLIAMRGRRILKETVEEDDGSQSTPQSWAGGAVVSAPILVSGGQRFESSPVHFFSLLSKEQNRAPAQRKLESRRSAEETAGAARCRVPAPRKEEHRRRAEEIAEGSSKGSTGTALGRGRRIAEMSARAVRGRPPM